MINKKAFTLTELLIALGIIGAIAAMSIPSTINKIHNDTLATSLKVMLGQFNKSSATN